MGIWICDHSLLPFNTFSVIFYPALHKKNGLQNTYIYFITNSIQNTVFFTLYHSRRVLDVNDVEIRCRNIRSICLESPRSGNFRLFLCPLSSYIAIEPRSDCICNRSFGMFGWSASRVIQLFPELFLYWHFCLLLFCRLRIFLAWNLKQRNLGTRFYNT